MSQLAIPDLEFEPTPAMAKGLSYVVQCSQCGLLACVVGGIGTPAPKRRDLGPCPACAGGPKGAGRWWQAELPVGPFRRVHTQQKGAP